jgi:serine phosphatase RsbU (regulator of sigma subunit)/anti-sigma regulatory factor (Ser/Thr protein kinase)
MSRRGVWLEGRPLEQDELIVESDEKNLSRIRDLVQHWAQEADFSRQQVYNLCLAVDEAATNIMRYAYRRGPGKIRICITRTTRYLRVELVDQGSSFDWHAQKTPDLNMYVATRRKGGLGIWFIRRMTDASRYTAQQDGNHLVLWKRLPRRAGLWAHLPAWLGGAGPKAASMRDMFIFRATLLMAFIIALVFSYGTWIQQSSLKARYMESAKSAAQNLAASSLDRLYKREDLLLTSLVNDVLAHDDSLAYALVVDDSGMILGHGDLAKVFTRYQPPPGVARSGSRPLVIPWMDPNLGRVDDIGVAILDGNRRFGEVHIGLREDVIRQAVRDQQVHLAVLGLLVLAVGVAGSWLLIKIIISPMRVLTEGVMAIGEGKLDHRINLTGTDEFGRIAAAFNEMTSSLTRAQQGKIEQEALKKELEVAKEIQRTLLPRAMPALEGYDLGDYYLAAKDVGGDYYDFIQVDRKHMGICVADVSGKGVPGSLVMTMIRTSLRGEARNNLSPAKVLGLVNEFVMDDMKKGMFVTLFYLVLDAHKREIRFACAGHDPLVLYRAATQKTYLLKPRGFPLGIQLSDRGQFARSLTEEKVHLSKGDILVAYTDGIVEAMNDRREQFGMDRFLSLVRLHHELPAAEFVQKVKEAVAAFTGEAPQFDDITLVAIKEGLSEMEMRRSILEGLTDLIERKKMSVAEACRRHNVTPAAWRYYKSQRKRLGKARALKGQRVVKEELRLVSLEERELIYPMLAKHPSWDARRLAQELLRQSQGAVRLEPAVIADDLARLKLDTPERRERFALRQRPLAAAAPALLGPAPSAEEGQGAQAAGPGQD